MQSVACINSRAIALPTSARVRMSTAVRVRVRPDGTFARPAGNNAAPSSAAPALGTCARCGCSINASAHEYVVRRCAHNMHAECYAVFASAGIVACSVCDGEGSAPGDGTVSGALGSATTNPFVVDVGCDTHLRALAMAELEQQRARRPVRTLECASARCACSPLPLAAR